MGAEKTLFFHYESDDRTFAPVKYLHSATIDHAISLLRPTLHHLYTYHEAGNAHKTNEKMSVFTRPRLVAPGRAASVCVFKSMSASKTTVKSMKTEGFLLQVLQNHCFKVLSPLMVEAKTLVKAMKKSCFHQASFRRSWLGSLCMCLLIHECL